MGSAVLNNPNFSCLWTEGLLLLDQIYHSKAKIAINPKHLFKRCKAKIPMPNTYKQIDVILIFIRTGGQNHAA